MKICSVCQRCCENNYSDCEERHGSLYAARPGSRQIIPGYQLDRLLERDRSGETYQASRAGFGEPSIIKLISPNSLNNPAQLGEIRREMHAVANLRHPNIAPIYESGLTERGEFFYATESLVGRTLRECLRNVGAFSEAEAVTFTRFVAEALEAAHGVGVVHRAVNPANINLAPEGKNLAVRLQNFDFGGVRQRLAVAAINDEKPPIDELRYLAPEQFAGQTADARSDVYSLGVVFYEMLCGRSPFGAPTVAAISQRQINEQPFENFNFEIRALLKHALIQALQKRPEARPQTAGNFARQLRHVEQLLGLTPAAPPPAVISAPPLKAAELISEPVQTVPEPLVSDYAPPPRENVQPENESFEPAAIETAAPIAAAPLIEENLPVETIGANEVQPENTFSAPIEHFETEHASEIFNSEPILAAKREKHADVFDSEPIAVRKIETPPIFTAEPIAVQRKISEEITAAPEFETGEIVTRELEPLPIIEAPHADIGYERETVTPTVEREAPPLFAGSIGADRRRTVPNRTPMLVGAGLLALLFAVVFGAYLYSRRQQQPIIAAAPTAAAPTVAPIKENNSADSTVAATIPEDAQSIPAKTETVEPTAQSAKSNAATAPTAARIENQPRETAAVGENIPKQNETPKTQTNSAANSAALAEPGTRPRVVSSGGEAEQQLNSSLNQLISATNQKNVEGQMNYYAPKMDAYYQTRNVSPAAVRAEKRRVFSQADQVDIQTGKPDIKLSPDGTRATMRFRKKYTIKKGDRSNQGEVVQELQWEKSGGRWQIVSERDVKVINH